jgi:hypothetical protein
MLEPAAADSSRVIHRALHTISFACCVLLIASFALFAHDQVAGASQHQQNELAAVTPTKAPVAHKVAQPRRFIDNAAHDLSSPFSSIVHSQNPWVVHGVPTFLALAVYGLGLGYLARFSRGMA